MSTSVTGTPSKATPLAAIAFAAFTAHDLPDGLEPNLEAHVTYDPPNFSWPFGTHMCLVEVDTETGDVDVLQYVAVDDCGNQVNPNIVEGQVHGGVVQGLAQALYERADYDSDGNLRLNDSTFSTLERPGDPERQLVREGRIHNYLRMLWGKKVLEWTESPEQAAEFLVRGAGVVNLELDRRSDVEMVTHRHRTSGLVHRRDAADEKVSCTTVHLVLIGGDTNLQATGSRRPFLGVEACEQLA